MPESLWIRNVLNITNITRQQYEIRQGMLNAVR